MISLYIIVILLGIISLFKYDEVEVTIVILTFKSSVECDTE